MSVVIGSFDFQRDGDRVRKNETAERRQLDRFGDFHAPLCATERGEIDFVYEQAYDIVDAHPYLVNAESRRDHLPGTMKLCNEGNLRWHF